MESAIPSVLAFNFGASARVTADLG